MMPVTENYYRRDFKARVRMTDSAGRPVDLRLLEADISLLFWTVSPLQSYAVQWPGDSCTLDDAGDSMIVAFDSHGLAPGPLRCEIELRLPDGTYPDASRRLSAVIEGDIRLVDTPVPSPDTATIEAVLPLIKGDPFTYDDLTEEQKEDLLAPVSERVAVLEEHADATDNALDEVSHRFVGVWDQLDAYGEAIRLLSEGELPSLLRRLGYDDNDIREFRYAVAHCDLGITLYDVQSAVEQWEQRASIMEQTLLNTDRLGPRACFDMKLLPKYTSEISIEFSAFCFAHKEIMGYFANYTGIKHFLLYFNSRSLIFLPQFEFSDTVTLQLPNARFWGGITYNKPFTHTINLEMPELRGIGRVTSQRVDPISNLVNLTYVGKWTIPLSWEFCYCTNLHDLSGFQLTATNVVPGAFHRTPTSGGSYWYYPLTKIGDWPIYRNASTVDYSSLLYGRNLASGTLRFVVRDRNSGYFNKLSSSDIVMTSGVTLRFEDVSSLKDSIPSDIENCENFLCYKGVTKVEIPRITGKSLDLCRFSTYNQTAENRYDFYIGEELDDIDRIESSSLGTTRILLHNFGHNNSDSIEPQVVDYASLFPINTVPPTVDPERDRFRDSFETWVDRVAAGYTRPVHIIITTEQYWSFSPTVVAEVTQKGYTLIIN